MRWETENYHDRKPRRITRTKILAVILIFAIMFVIGYAGTQAPSSTPPPPIDTTICKSPATNCFNNQVDKNSFNAGGLFWQYPGNSTWTISNNTQIPPTIRPDLILTDIVDGVINFQFHVDGNQPLNLTTIRIYDENMSYPVNQCQPSRNNCATYTCVHICPVFSVSLYFKISIPMRAGDIYHITFATSNNGYSFWEIRFHT